MKIKEDKKKNPKKYLILCGEMGLAEEQVFTMKDANLNFEL
jgi:hypothetical protein